MLAAGRGLDTIVELLLKHNVDVNRRSNIGWTALMQAADAGHENIVSLLIAAGTSMDDIDMQDCTALMRAASQGHFAVVTLLVEQGRPLRHRHLRVDSTVLRGEWISSIHHRAFTSARR